MGEKMLRFPISRFLRSAGTCTLTPSIAISISRAYIVRKYSTTPSFQSKNNPSATTPAPTAALESNPASGPPQHQIQIPGRLLIGMTCKPCGTRINKSMSKQAYERGVVIITCDGCGVKHLISDHLGWFDTTRKNVVGTIEDILREKGREGEIDKRVLSGGAGGAVGISRNMNKEELEAGLMMLLEEQSKTGRVGGQQAAASDQQAQVEGLLEYLPPPK